MVISSVSVSVVPLHVGGLVNGSGPLATKKNSAIQSYDPYLQILWPVEGLVRKRFSESRLLLLPLLVF